MLLNALPFATLVLAFAAAWRWRLRGAVAALFVGPALLLLLAGGTIAFDALTGGLPLEGGHRSEFFYVWFVLRHDGVRLCIFSICGSATAIGVQSVLRLIRRETP